MNKLRYRFLLYAIIGLTFGIIDWFYLNWLAHISWGSLRESILVIPIIIGMNYGIWLVPIIPVVIYEALQTKRIRNPVVAGILTWSFAIFSYYFYYAILLSLGKLPNHELLNIFGDKNAAFWPKYWRMFNRIILGQFFEWIITAVVGGAFFGALSFRLIHRRSKDLANGYDIQKLEE